jgi:alkanesulfonate monooxygenase SsuD/methylene tetrahydromethanopterin reductase-like flavin-dependent oxidoreductase (luciferase family)
MSTSAPAHPFRFGAVTAVDGDAATWASAARSLEEAGYATLLVPDTLWTPSPFLALTAAASATTTLRLGTWVLSAPLRRPAEVVREAATLQRLSDGRLELGVGAGRPGGERDAATLGATWGAPGERVGRVEQTLEAVAAGVDPVPRLVVAAAGDRMLRIAARLAQTVALPASPTADLDAVADLADRARTAGAHLELALQIVAIGDAMPGFLRGQGLTPDGLSGAAAALSGDLDRDVDAVHALRERTGVSYLTVPGELAAAASPLVAALAGR